MSTSPAPSAVRGDITLQPSYFTSSLFVDLLREDIESLITAFSDRYKQDKSDQPFSSFKQLWVELGWSWFHFKVFDGRARHSFISVTERLMLERMGDTEDLLARVTCLFALYTFHQTQPSGSTPALYSLRHIAIPMDLYTSVLALPSALSKSDLASLAPYTKHVLSALVDTSSFQVLPHSNLRALNPSVLPREIFVPDGMEASALAGKSTDVGPVASKKKGRPSKREKMRKAKDALVALEKYIDKNSVMLAGGLTFGQMGGTMDLMTQFGLRAAMPAQITHALVAQPPSQTRIQYSAQKQELMDVLYTPVSEEVPNNLPMKALERANEAVLGRLKKIDQMAAEKGLEVGGEGGEKTGLVRVEKAARELHARGALGQRGGILGLLEGGGLQTFDTDASMGVEPDTQVLDDERRS